MAVLEQTAPRIDWKTFQETVPEFATAMAAVTHALKKSGIEPEIRELIKIRASQINGCAFCIQYHLNDARKISVPAAKLDLLAAWRDAGIYSSRERAARRVARSCTGSPPRALRLPAPSSGICTPAGPWRGSCR